MQVHALNSVTTPYYDACHSCPTLWGKYNRMSLLPLDRPVTLAPHTVVLQERKRQQILLQLTHMFVTFSGFQYNYPLRNIAYSVCYLYISAIINEFLCMCQNCVWVIAKTVRLTSKSDGCFTFSLLQTTIPKERTCNKPKKRQQNSTLSISNDGCYFCQTCHSCHTSPCLIGYTDVMHISLISCIHIHTAQITADMLEVRLPCRLILYMKVNGSLFLCRNVFRRPVYRWIS